MDGFYDLYAFMYVCVSGWMGAWMDARENTHYTYSLHCSSFFGGPVLWLGSYNRDFG